MILLVIFSFLAGLVTVMSPCILPILPIILTSSIGGQQIGKSRPLGVVTGFVLSFTFFTLFLSTIVRLSGLSADSIRLFSVIVIAGFGLSLIISRFQIAIEQLFSKLVVFMPNKQGSVGLPAGKQGFGGGLLIGLSVGLLWTPCVGPILASVISLAITGALTFDAFLITLAYALGTAIPMFLIMLGGQNALKRVPWLMARLGQIQKIFGVLMILTAVGIFFNIDRKFQIFILDTFPSYGVGLTKFEDNELIRSELDKQSSSAESNNLSKSKMSLDNRKVKAPELIPGGVWFNLPADRQALTTADLKGKVVLIGFWTYSCINCQRTLPYLKNWYQKYKDQGLVIIGVHSPEFEFEKSEKNVARAIKDFDLTYPIVQDNEFATWRAYNNRYWPAKYFIDKDGYIRHFHFGEGAYDESEKVIQELLQEAGSSQISSEINNPTHQNQAKTPEIYLGFDRIDYFASPENIKLGEVLRYTAPKNLGVNKMAFEGEWIVLNEYANPQKGAKLHLNFDAQEVFLVMRAKNKTSVVKVYIDDQLKYFGEDNLEGVVKVEEDDLYKLIKLDAPGKYRLRLEFEDSNAELFAFTFG